MITVVVTTACGTPDLCVKTFDAAFVVYALKLLMQQLKTFDAAFVVYALKLLMQHLLKTCFKHGRRADAQEKYSSPHMFIVCCCGWLSLSAPRARATICSPLAIACCFI